MCVCVCVCVCLCVREFNGKKVRGLCQWHLHLAIQVSV